MEVCAELISIGNELLNGRTLNTHGRDLGEALAALGLQLTRDTTIPDHIPTIETALKEALKRVDLVFISGGLGPTVDDITRDALALALDRKIVLDQGAVAAMTARYAARDRGMTPAAERQALVLENAVVLPNSAGAAPGQRIDLDRKTLFILPGPPHEFNAILNEEIVPWMKKQFTQLRPKAVRIIRTKGIGECDLVTLLDQSNFEPQKIALGFYPGRGQVEIHLTAAPGHEAQVSEAALALEKLLFDFIDHETR